MKKIYTFFLILIISSLSGYAQNPKPVLNVANTNTNMNTSKDILKNPLLMKWNTPFQAPPFDEIKNEHYLPAFEWAVKDAQREIDLIVQKKEKPTFYNTVEALDNVGATLNRIQNVFFNMLSCNTDEKLQDLATKISPMLTQFQNELYHNKLLFERIKTVKKNDSKLTDEQKMLLDKTYRAFENNGANLDPDKQATFNNLTQELSKLSLQFNQNVLASTNAFNQIFNTTEELQGMPKDVLNVAAERAKEKNLKGLYFDLSAPSYTAIMKYADNRDIRHQFFMAYNTRGMNEFDNQNIIKNIVAIRQKLAILLGYDNYADYALQDRMAENADNVFMFLDKLYDVAYPQAQNEIKKLFEYAELHGFKGTHLEQWDVSYYIEKMKSEKFDVNDEMLKPYFVLENVIDGVFRLSKDLFQLEYKENKSIPVYHPEVKVYEVYRAQQFMGLLYLDFHPRESKRSGAWMTTFRDQFIHKGKNIRPIVSLVMNFTPSTQEKPSLLTYDEVHTFLHEFGHGLHALLSNVTYQSLSGTNVPRDFVEFPSQFLENWASEPHFLNTFASHYVTGEKIPQKLIDKIIEAENFMSGYYFCRQLNYGYLDMMWHTSTKPIENVVTTEKQALKKLNLLPEVKEQCYSTAFSHIFSGGYAAGYYSYKWSEVLEADAFAMFKKKGVYNSKLASDYVDKVLSKGGSAKAMDLYLAFRGKKPDSNALLRKSGLLK